VTWRARAHEIRALGVNGQRLVASITAEADRELGLQDGTAVTAIGKALDTSLATAD
jgi:molybdopterin-binding protein